MQKKPRVIFLMGPTASGKTDLAVELVQHLPCDIISVDSAMVYREMNIGTAKPTQEILAIAPHRLIDLCDPAENYSAAQFCVDAQKEINAIHAQDRIPLLVGGTMLYFRALQQGLSPLPSADPQIRAKLLEEIKADGLSALYEKLEQIDPESAQRIHCNDPQRIQRALEVYEITGKPMSYLLNMPGEVLAYDITQLAIIPNDRNVLHQRIAQRFDAMLKKGFVDEVISLYERGDLHEDLPSIRAVGYRQIWDYLKGSYNYESMRERGIIASRQLAKRQMTWLRSWAGLQIFDQHNHVLFTKILNYIQSHEKNDCTF